MRKQWINLRTFFTYDRKEFEKKNNFKSDSSIDHRLQSFRITSIWFQSKINKILFDITACVFFFSDFEHEFYSTFIEYKSIDFQYSETIRSEDEDQCSRLWRFLFQAFELTFHSAWWLFELEKAFICQDSRFVNIEHLIEIYDCVRIRFHNETWSRDHDE
jgi:hypothetical protein